MDMATQAQAGSLRSKKTIGTSVAAGLGAIALAIGMPAAAHAATIDITSEHTDIVSIGATEVVGSSFDQIPLFASWNTTGGYTNGNEYPIVFDNAAWIAEGNSSLCASGTYTVPNDHDIEEFLPFVGFNYPDGNGTNDFEVSVELTSGQTSSGDVRFYDESNQLVLDTDDTLIFDLTEDQHEHFAIQLDGTCGVDATYYLTFTVENVGTSAVRTLDTVFTVTN